MFKERNHMKRSFLAGMWFIVVLALIAIGLPNCLYFDCKVLQSEAKSGLREIGRAEQEYRRQHGRYGSIQELARFDPTVGETIGRAERYTFHIKTPSVAEYIAEAIDEKKRLVPTGQVVDRWIMSSSNPGLMLESNACSQDTVWDFWIRRLD